MNLERISDHVYFLPPDDFKDRPLLGYVAGTKMALAIDGGFSPDQVCGFYDQFDVAGLKHPDLTALTHWHWDHTLGLPAVKGLVVASDVTNELLAEEKKRLTDEAYEKRLRRFYVYVDREFPHGRVLPIRTAEIEFHDSLRLDLGGVTAELRHIDAPHTPDSTIIFIPEEKILFLGDASLGAFEKGGSVDAAAKANLIETVASIDCHTVLLGHEGKLSKDDFLYYQQY